MNNTSREELPPKLITRNGEVQDRIDRVRDSRKPVTAIDKNEKQMRIVPVAHHYTKERKQFKNKNHDKIKLSETLLREGLKQKQFYPYIIREPEKVSLKDNKPNIEMKRGRINTNEVVLSRDGQESFLISQFFNNYAFVECSFQFLEDPYVLPDFDFFVFDTRKTHHKEVTEIFKNASEDMMGNEANEIRKQFKKLSSQLSFLQTLHMLVADILPDWCNPQPESHPTTYDQKLESLVYPATLDSLIQCNDDRFDYEVQPPHLYFTDISVLNNHKLKQTVFIKRLNIYSKEMEVFSDIRNILHPEKTYFIQIMEEVKQAIATARDIIGDDSFDIEILHQVYELIETKSKQFLLLICTYIPSSIDLQVRTDKLSEYFWSNFMYMQEIHEASPEMLQKYNVLGSWYSMPERMFGYRREEIQKNFYDLVRSGCQIQRILNFKRKLHDLTQVNIQKLAKKLDKQRTQKKKTTK